MNKPIIIIFGIIAIFVVDTIKVHNIHAQNWQIQTVDTSPGAGHYTSIILDSLDQPHISYQIESSPSILRLYYARWTGTTWEIDSVDTEDRAGYYTSIELDNSGNPIISYTTEPPAGHELRVALKTGPTWAIETVDTASVKVRYSSLELDDLGDLHISYGGLGFLKYAQWTGSSWQINTLNTDGIYSTSIALDNLGNPHISYEVFSGTENLMHAQLSGSTWTSEEVDTTGKVGYHTSIAIDSPGNPHISYSHFNGSVKYAFWTGMAWAILTVDNIGGSGNTYTSLVLDESGYPHISYGYSASTGGLAGVLKYARWTGSVWDIETVDSLNNVGSSVSLALDSFGNPHISYHQGLDPQWVGTLKYATKILTGVEEEMENPKIPREELLQNHPNPFHQSTKIQYSLPKSGAITLTIYDITGRLVDTLVDEKKEPGVYQIQWEGKDLASGIYFYRLQAGDLKSTKKMVLLR